MAKNPLNITNYLLKKSEIDDKIFYYMIDLCVVTKFLNGAKKWQNLEKELK